MSDAMVTGRMSINKKSQGARVLANAGLSVSQAINMMYDRLLEEGNASFLNAAQQEPAQSPKWQSAAQFVDTIPKKRTSRFHAMSNAEIKMDRLHAKGLI